ncbi:MAG: hypothetical protein QM715_04750 [Nibricoccus sp.]
MTSVFQDVQWRFGGTLGGLDSQLAWLVLGLAAVLGLLLLALSYHYTLVRLSTGRKIVLTGLRFLLLLLLLVLLAGPVRVEKKYSQQYHETLRPLAVLVDRSDSMRKPDNRRQQRGDDARRRWLAIEPAARKAFSDVASFAFARGVEKIADVDAPAALAGDRTELFAALQQVLKQAPAGGWGGVITLTDGIDTSGSAASEQVESTVRSALGTGTPLYFVPGRNRYTGKSFFTLRDWNAPGTLAPRSTFQLEVTLDSYQPAARSVPVRFRVGNNQKPTETLRLEAGRHMYTWTAEIGADNIGLLPIELQIGDAEQAVVARAEIRVQAPGNNRILFFQGALDWGYKFLADMLRDDPEFTFTPILALAPNYFDNSAKGFPSTAAALLAYDVIVLANAAAQQFSPAQQAALTEWVKNGGVLMFFAPDDASANGFAGSELEKMLPVVFLNSNPVKGTRPKSSGGSSRSRVRYGHAGGSGQAIELAEFAWEPDAQEIFGQGGAMVSPKFSSYAQVLRAKPGAVVLARHPSETSPAGGDGSRAILLAMQRYGRGQSAVLTSDALWRWKLNEESSAKGAEKFWRHLFAWLGRDRIRDLVFDHAPLSTEIGQDVVLRLVGGGSAPIHVYSVFGGQVPVEIPRVMEGGETLSYRWRPSGAGEWELRAIEENGRVARHWMRVQDTGNGPAGENSNSAVDEVLMAKLAERTGGVVLNETVPEQWIAPREPAAPEIVSERTTQLWHRRWVLALLIGCYGVELLLRRRWFLL